MSAEHFGKQSYRKIIKGDLVGSIRILNGAIAKYPKEKRFYTNRCYCFTLLQEYVRAKQDASYLINNFTNYPNGYFQLGEIYLKTREFELAEKMFEKANNIIKTGELEDKILEARIYQLVDKGFTISRSRRALDIAGDIEQAVQCLIQDVIPERDPELDQFVIVFDIEEEEHLNRILDDWLTYKVIQTKKNLLKKVGKVRNDSSCSEDLGLDPSMDPKNPRKCPGLWIGNAGGMTEDKLRKLFSKFGKIKTCSVFNNDKSNKHYGFVNFENYESAGPAMTALQGYKIGDKQFMIKFPKSTSRDGF